MTAGAIHTDANVAAATIASNRDQLDPDNHAEQVTTNPRDTRLVETRPPSLSTIEDGSARKDALRLFSIQGSQVVNSSNSVVILNGVKDPSICPCLSCRRCRAVRSQQVGRFKGNSNGIWQAIQGSGETRARTAR